MVQLSQPYMTTGKTIALTKRTFVGGVMSPLFFFFFFYYCLGLSSLPRSNRLLISWLQSPSAVILEPNKRKSVITSTFPPFYLPWSNGAGCHDLIFFLIFGFKLTLSLSSFTLIKRLFSFSLLSATKVVSYAYLRLLMFLLPILILACNSSNISWHFSWCAQHIG